jgi:hypothetical protein
MKICLEFPTWKEMLFFFYNCFHVYATKNMKQDWDTCVADSICIVFFHHKEAIKMNIFIQAIKMFVSSYDVHSIEKYGLPRINQ